MDNCCKLLTYRTQHTYVLQFDLYGMSFFFLSINFDLFQDLNTLEHYLRIFFHQGKLNEYLNE